MQVEKKKTKNKASLSTERFEKVKKFYFKVKLRPNQQFLVKLILFIMKQNEIYQKHQKFTCEPEFAHYAGLLTRMMPLTSRRHRLII